MTAALAVWCFFRVRQDRTGTRDEHEMTEEPRTSMSTAVEDVDTKQ